MMTELQRLQKRFSDHLVEVRGLGLLIGLEFVDSEFGYAVAADLFKRGILVAGTLLNAKTIRIEPALNIPREPRRRGAGEARGHPRGADGVGDAACSLTP